MRKGWKTVCLSDVLIRRTDRLGKSPEPTILTCTENHGLVDQLVHLGRRAATEDVGKYKLVEPMDIVYNVYLLWLGSIGQNLTGTVGVTSPVYEVFTPVPEVHAPYLGYLLRSPGMVERYGAIAIGTVPRRRRTPWEAFLNLSINLPPFEEQQRIVDLVGSLDEAIESANGAAENSKILATQIRRQMISSREANTSFRDVAELKRGFDLPVGQRGEGQIPVIASGGPVGSHNEAKVLGPGVVTGRSGTIGVVQYIMDDFWPLNTTLYVKDFKTNFPAYIRYLLEAMDLEHHAGGSTVPSLNRNVLDNIRVYVPDMRTQQLIAETLDSVWASVIAATAYAGSLRTLRSELLNVLLSGEHEIPESYDVDTAAQLEPAA